MILPSKYRYMIWLLVRMDFVERSKQQRPFKSIIRCATRFGYSLNFDIHGRLKKQ